MKFVIIALKLLEFRADDGSESFHTARETTNNQAINKKSTKNN